MSELSVESSVRGHPCFSWYQHLCTDLPGSWQCDRAKLSCHTTVLSSKQCWYPHRVVPLLDCTAAVAAIAAFVNAFTSLGADQMRICEYGPFVARPRLSCAAAGVQLSFVSTAVCAAPVDTLHVGAGGTCYCQKLWGFVCVLHQQPLPYAPDTAHCLSVCDSVV